MNRASILVNPSNLLDEDEVLFDCETPSLFSSETLVQNNMLSFIVVGLKFGTELTGMISETFLLENTNLTLAACWNAVHDHLQGLGLLKEFVFIPAGYLGDWTMMQSCANMREVLKIKAEEFRERNPAPNTKPAQTTPQAFDDDFDHSILQQIYNESPPPSPHHHHHQPVPLHLPVRHRDRLEHTFDTEFMQNTHRSRVLPHMFDHNDDYGDDYGDDDFDHHNHNDATNDAQFERAMQRSLEDPVPKQPVNRRTIDQLLATRTTGFKGECSICQDEILPSHEIVTTPCLHHFHVENQNCSGLKPWLEKNNACPVCRHPLDEQNNSTSQHQPQQQRQPQHDPMRQMMAWADEANLFDGGDDLRIVHNSNQNNPRNRSNNRRNRNRNNHNQRFVRAANQNNNQPLVQTRAQAPIFVEDEFDAVGYGYNSWDPSR